MNGIHVSAKKEILVPSILPCPLLLFITMKPDQLYFGLYAWDT